MITDLQLLQSALSRLRAQGNDVAASAIREGAEVVRLTSQVNVPIDTGALHDSHVLTDTERTANTATVRVEAGGPTVEYAIRVHEDLNMRHPRGGTAKYLERAVIEKAPVVGAIFEQRVSAVLQ